MLGLGHLTTVEFLVIGTTGRLFGTILLTLGGTYIRHEQYQNFWISDGSCCSRCPVGNAFSCAHRAGVADSPYP